MSRADDYAAFLATRPDFAAVVAKVRAERNVVDKTLTWARLKYAYVDYNPHFILKSILDGQPIDDRYADDATKLRYGWRRWEEIRLLINSVDQWLQSPSPASAESTLRAVMVTIPDRIDVELDAWSKNRTVLIQKAKEAGQEIVEATGSALSTIAAPIVVVALAGAAYNWSKRK